MKRYGGLWEELVSWPNLLLAARKARRGKGDRAAVQRFEFDRERELARLREELTDGGYRPGAFSTHWITRPKARLISAAPYRDRVVHHALMNVLEPILDRHFHPRSYACRKGKGTHAAADRVQVLLGRRRWVAHLDIRKYFPSIDHEILKGMFRGRIKDGRVLELMDRIVDGSNPQEEVTEYFPGDDLFAPYRRRRGLPIGNLTSQWFANWYLTGLDYHVTERLRVGGFVRYCDDVVLAHDDRGGLKGAIDATAAYLGALRLRLHEGGKTQVKASRMGVRFVGFRVWARHRLVRKENVRRFRRRVRWMRRAYAAWEVDWEDIKPRLASWMGHARQADSERLFRRLSREWTFARGQAVDEPCPSRRQLEQQSSQLPVGQPQQEHARQPEQQHRVSGGGGRFAALSGARSPVRPESRGLRAARV